MTSSQDVTKIIGKYSSYIKKLKTNTHVIFLVNITVFCENNMKKLKLIY